MAHTVEADIVGQDERLYAAHRIVPLAAHLEGYGIPADALLFETGVPHAALYDPSVLISRSQVVSVFERFVEIAPAHVSPLELGASFKVTDLGLYGFALLSSPTVEDAIRFALTHRQLAAPIVDMSLITVGNESAWVLDGFPELIAHPRIVRFAFEYQIGVMLALHRAVIDLTFQWTNCDFSYPIPEGSHSYDLVLTCPYRFNAVSTQLRFETELLSRPTHSANRLTFRTVKTICDSLVRKIQSSRKVTKRVIAELVSSPGQYPSASELAGRLEMTTADFTSALANEHTTYEQLSTEVKFQLASSYLRQTDLTIDAIAPRLGFKDSADFQDTFREWSGVLPGEYRDIH